MKLFIYALLMVLLLPLFLLGFPFYMVPILLGRKRVSGTAYGPFNGRLVYHLSGNSMIPIDPAPKTKGKSKLKKWTCGCQIVRIGKREFCATCDICGNKFVLDE